jgi:hypothetical protein
MRWRNAGMAGKLWIATGFAAGYVLGSRAGRQRYEQLAEAARRVRDDPAVQSAVGAVQERASRLYTDGKSAVTQKLGSSRAGRTDADLDADLVNAAAVQP